MWRGVVCVVCCVVVWCDVGVSVGCGVVLVLVLVLVWCGEGRGGERRRRRRWEKKCVLFKKTTPLGCGEVTSEQ